MSSDPNVASGRAASVDTEATNPRSAHLDAMGTLELLELMNDEDTTVPAAVRLALPAIARAVEAIVGRLVRGGRLVYVGAGTSGRLAKLDALECVPTFSVPPSLVSAIVAGGDAALVASVEGAEDDLEQALEDVASAGIGEADVLVGLAASGRTPYVMAALREARARGALTVAISNNDRAPILDIADHPIAIVTGPEVLAGSTRLKAGTAQKLTLNMISTAAMVHLGKVYGNRMIDLRVTNHKLRVRAQGIVADLVGCDPARAVQLLDEAGQDVRTAVLMGLAGIDADGAQAALARSNGDLRGALIAARFDQSPREGAAG